MGPRRARVVSIARALAPLALVLAIATAVLPAEPEPRESIGGEWELAGRSGQDRYTGKAKISKLDDGRFVIGLSFVRASGKSGAATFVGRWNGRRLVGKRTASAGAAAAVAGSEEEKGLHATYTLSRDGDTLDGKSSGIRETLTRARAVSPAKFRRAVLCLDGLPYRVMEDLQRRGRFKDFYPASRMISPFPSLTNISWGRLLDLPPEAGYQAVHFSNHLNRSVGYTMNEVVGLRFERRMHHRIEGLVSHGLAYIAPEAAGRQSLRRLLRSLIDHEGSETAFAYALETDSIAHMRGRETLERLLCVVDDEIAALSAEFRARHGRKLEIAIVSDHGHTLTPGKMVDLEGILKLGGYKVRDEVRGSDDVAYALAGILSSIALHCHEEIAPDVARLLMHMEGADLCVFRLGREAVRVVSTRGEATFVHDQASDSYGYYPDPGADPLDHRRVYAALAAAGKLDGRGFARARDLFLATAAHPYPDALARIRHALTDLVRSPANVIVSLKTGYESGRGFVKAAAKLVGRNGTHGGLGQDESAGVYMTNYRRTPDAIAGPEFKREVDLGDYKANPPSVEVSIEPRFDGDGVRTGGEVSVLVRDDGAKASAARGEKTTIRVSILRARFLLSDVRILAPVEGDEATLPAEGPAFVVKLPGAPALLEMKKNYRFEVVIERRDRSGKLVASETRDVAFAYNGTFQTTE